MFYVIQIQNFVFCRRSTDSAFGRQRSYIEELRQQIKIRLVDKRDWISRKTDELWLIN